MGARLALFHFTSQKNAFRNSQVSLTLAHLSQTKHGARRTSREHRSDAAPPCSVLLRLRSGGFQVGDSSFCVLEDCPRGSQESSPTPQFKSINSSVLSFLYGPILTSIHNYCSVQLRSIAQSCPTRCDPMNCSTPGLPVHHQLPEFTQTHVH